MIFYGMVSLFLIFSAFVSLAVLFGIRDRIHVDRLRRKFEHDRKRMADLVMLSMGSSPVGILKSLLTIDDDEK